MRSVPRTRALQDERCEGGSAGTLLDWAHGRDGCHRSRGLYRVDPDGNVQLMLDGLSIPNGLDRSPDATAMYFIDTADA